MNFCEMVNNDYSANWHHELIGKKLEECLEKVLRGENARLIIQVPPRHGKSETATMNFPAWVLGKYPKMKIIVSSYSDSLAEYFGLKTRDIMKDEVYSQLFKTRIREDNSAKGKWMTDEGGGYVATGIGGGITGRGFNIGIIDDPVRNREDAESKLKRDLVWNWYTSTFYTRQEGNGAIIVILTRWHMDDLVGRLLKKQAEDEASGVENYDKWEIINLPAIAEEDEVQRSIGEALWPQKYDLQNLLTKKNTLGPYDWNALYQQRPISNENQEFLKENFQYFEDKDIANKELVFTTTVDLAVSQKQTADNTVLLTIGKELYGSKMYIVDITSGRFTPLETIDAMFMIFKKYRTKFSIESVGYQKALKYFVEEEMRRRGMFFMVDELKNTKKRKEERIRGLIPFYRTKVIYHRPTHTKLEDELLTFPFGVHDDHADALAMQLEVIQHAQAPNPVIRSITQKELYSAI